MEDWLRSAWDAGHDTRSERRERRRFKKRHGMQVSGTSVKVLATLVPKAKRRRQKKGRNRR